MRFERLNKKALVKAIQDGVRVELESVDFTVPRVALPLLVTMAEALVRRAPEELEPAAAKALGDVKRQCGVGKRAVMKNAARVPKVDKGALRQAAIRQTVIVRSVVEAVAASADEGDAARAMHVYDALFAQMPRIAVLKPRQVVAAVQVMEERLGDDPGLRAELDQVVPVATTNAALAAQRALARAVGPSQEDVGAPAVDLVPIRDALRRRVMRYAAAMLATAEPEDKAARHRVLAALQPIVELQADVTPQRKRTKATVAAAPPAAPAVAVAPAVTAPPTPEGRATD